MIRNTWVFIAVCLFAASLTNACGSDNDTRRDIDLGQQLVEVDTPELEAIDDRLDGIEGETKVLKEDIQALQNVIADKMVTDDITFLAAGLEGGRAYMEVDANDVLRVNGMAMNKTEFESYTTNRGQDICQPTPVLVVDPRGRLRSGRVGARTRVRSALLHRRDSRAELRGGG